MIKNNIKINSNSTVYLVIPNVVTGGPEALHQLALELKKNLLSEFTTGHLLTIMLYIKNIKLNIPTI
jgi:hypothetical protein